MHSSVWTNSLCALGIVLFCGARIGGERRRFARKIKISQSCLPGKSGDQGFESILEAGVKIRD